MIEVYSLDHNGRGIGKLDGKIIFIENALVGEIVEPLIIKENKKYITAKVKRYIKKSKERLENICPYYDSCGGCNIMHMKYEDQLMFKQNKIQDIINKYAKIDVKVDKIIPNDTNFNFRNKSTFHVMHNKLGFYNENTHNIIEIDECKLLDNKINLCIPYLKKLDLSKISQIVCRSSETELMVIIETSNLDLNIDILKAVTTSIYLRKDENYYLVYGKKNITHKLKKYSFLISPDSFFQTNYSMCEKLYDTVKNYIGNNKSVLDLYCGTGSIGIYVSEKNQIIGIEINESAIKDANENKDLNKLDNIEFICGDSGKNISKIKDKPDFVIIDPPRSGLNNETLKNILKIEAKNIIYVSCDPMTLARDINILKEEYNILKIIPFDMFPNTKHVETTCVLERK